MHLRDLTCSTFVQPPPLLASPNHLASCCLDTGLSDLCTHGECIQDHGEALSTCEPEKPAGEEEERSGEGKGREKEKEGGEGEGSDVEKKGKEGGRRSQERKEGRNHGKEKGNKQRT